MSAFNDTSGQANTVYYYRVRACVVYRGRLVCSDYSSSSAGSRAQGSASCGFGLYRPSGGSNKFFLDVDQSGTADVSFEFGPVGSDVYVGKWGGTTDNVAVRREIGGNGLGKFFLNTDTTPRAESAFVLGRLGDEPIWGDFTGTGRATLGIKRNVGGIAKYFVDTTGNGRPNSVHSFNRFNDSSFVGDWDGSGSDNIGTVKIVGVGLKWDPAERQRDDHASELRPRLNGHSDRG